MKLYSSRLLKANLLSIFIILLSFSNGICQNITIGLKADVVNIIIASEVQNDNDSQGYNQVTEQYAPQYYNGKLSDIILCKQNVPFVDLKRTGDFCTHYIIKGGILTLIVVEYSNISVEEIRSFMDANLLKIGDYYIGSGDTTYCKVYLSETGEAVKEYGNTRYEPLPKSIEKQLSTIREVGSSIEPKQTTTFPSETELHKLNQKSFIVKCIITSGDYIKQTREFKSYNIKLYDPYSTTPTLTRIKNKIGLLEIKYANGKLFGKYYMKYINVDNVYKLGCYDYQVLPEYSDGENINVSISYFDRDILIDKTPFRATIQIEIGSNDPSKQRTFTFWGNIIH